MLTENEESELIAKRRIGVAKKSLLLMVGLDFILICAFMVHFVSSHSFVPVFIGVLPVTLCNYIYVREFVAPRPRMHTEVTETIQPRRASMLPLLIIPIGFCVALAVLDIVERVTVETSALAPEVRSSRSS